LGCALQIFTSMLYAAGLPLLIPIAAAAMFVTYWVDKFLFCRFYSTPPLVSWGDGPSMLSSRRGLRCPVCGLALGTCTRRSRRC
jgi:hypothetical protein